MKKANGALHVERGIPPPTRKNLKGVSTAIAAMKVGESFLSQIGQSAGNYYPIFKRLGYECATQRQPDGKIRIWRTA